MDTFTWKLLCVGKHLCSVCVMCNVCSILISVFWIFQPWPLWQQVSVELGKWDGQYDERWVGGYYKKSLLFTTQSYLQSVSSLLSVWPHLVAVLLCCCHIPGCCCLLLQQKAVVVWLLVTVCTLSARLSTVDWALSVATPGTRHRPADRASRPCHHTRPHTHTRSESETCSKHGQGVSSDTQGAPPWSPSCPPGVWWPCSPPHWTRPGLAGPGWQQAGCAATDSRLCSVTHWRISVCKVRARHAGCVCCLSPAPCPHDMNTLHQNMIQVTTRTGPVARHAGDSFMRSHWVSDAAPVCSSITMGAASRNIIIRCTESGRGRANQPGPEQSWVAGFYKTDWNWKLFVRFGV